MVIAYSRSALFFFFNDTATTEIYTLSLHDALPISRHIIRPANAGGSGCIVPGHIRLSFTSDQCGSAQPLEWRDRKSTRLNSSHDQISYAVFCLKKKKAMGSVERALTTTSVVIVQIT